MSLPSPESLLLPSKPLAAASDLANAKGIAAGVTLYDGRRAKLRLHIAIVGCGLGGLAAAFTLSKAGHHVTILESTASLGEVGAGIQVSPNSCRLLHRWGLRPALERVAVRPAAFVLRRYSTGEKIAYGSFEDQEARYGAPYLHIHRADFHRLLYDLIDDTDDVDVRLNSTVTNLDPADPPRLTLASGETITADLVVGADGVRSTVRQVVVGRPDQPIATGDAAYRALLPISLIEHDPELSPLVTTPYMTCWIGPGRHLIIYSVRARRELNLVLAHPDDGSVESWTAEGSADKMRADYANFEPRVQKLLALVPSTLKWKLMDRAPLESWVHPAGRVTLLGDACHPMLPYRAQGSAMAIEDAALLGNLFSHVAHPAQIAPLLHAYEKLRLPRTAATQASSRLNQKVLHLPDGPAQEARDAEMRAAMHEEEAAGFEGNLNQWAERKKNDVQFGYDADEEADRWWREEGAREVGTLAEGGGADSSL